MYHVLLDGGLRTVSLLRQGHAIPSRHPANQFRPFGSAKRAQEQKIRWVNEDSRWHNVLQHASTSLQNSQFLPDGNIVISLMALFSIPIWYGVCRCHLIVLLEELSGCKTICDFSASYRNHVLIIGYQRMQCHHACKSDYLPASVPVCSKPLCITAVIKTRHC